MGSFSACPIHHNIIRVVAIGVIHAALMIPSAIAQDIGKVIALVPGVSVLRDGKTEALALRSGIRVSDTIHTNATGRVKILFNDDSSVSLGSNTTMDMKEYADSGSKPVFGIHVPQGLIRAITGKIVERNPEGFNATTPEVTVGIRGTIISIRVDMDVTTVYVENTARQVLVNNISISSGYKIALPAGVIQSEPILPRERRELGHDLALRGGTGVAAAAPDPTLDGFSSEERFLVATPGITPDTPLADIAQAAQHMGESIADSPAVSVPNIGHVSGSLVASTAGNNLAGGAFGFDVNLSEGTIYNGHLSLSTVLASGLSLDGGAYSAAANTPVEVNLRGLSGNATSSDFVMGGPGNQVAVGNYSMPNGVAYVGSIPPGQGNPPFNLSNQPAGLPFGVNYYVGDTDWNQIDKGIGIGVIAK